MRKLLFIALLAAACSRDIAETQNPAGDPARPLQEAAPVTQADTAPPATPTASSTSGTATPPPTNTVQTATGQQP